MTMSNAVTATIIFHDPQIMVSATRPRYLPVPNGVLHSLDPTLLSVAERRRYRANGFAS